MNTKLKAVDPVPSLIYSFGERDEDNQWYAHKDGIRIKCNEEIIDKLYWQWIMNPTAKKTTHSNGYTIFTVDNPALAL